MNLSAWCYEIIATELDETLLCSLGVIIRRYDLPAWVTPAAT